MHRYFLLNKPRDMVSQFVSCHEVNLLGNLNFTFPSGTHALGRLDKDSEGLLLLTTDKRAGRLLFLDDVPHLRTYLVMVQNHLSENTFEQLKTGIAIKIKNGENYVARPAEIQRINDATSYYTYAMDQREMYPHTWLLITLTEGKYRAGAQNGAGRKAPLPAADSLIYKRDYPQQFETRRSNGNE